MTTASGVVLHQRTTTLLRVRVPAALGGGSFDLRKPVPGENTRAPGVTRSKSLLRAATIVFNDPDAWTLDLNTEPLRRMARVLMVVSWAMQGWTAAQAQAWREIGCSSPLLTNTWTRNGFTAQDAAAWLAAPSVVPMDSNLAAQYRALGATPADTAHAPSPKHRAFVIAANVPHGRGWEDLLRVCEPSFASVAFKQGASAAAALTVAKGCIRQVGPDPVGVRGLHYRERTQWRAAWTPAQEQQANTLASTLDGLDWDDVATCVRAGMSVDAAREHVAAGAEMEPVRLLAALT